MTFNSFLFFIDYFPIPLLFFTFLVLYLLRSLFFYFFTSRFSLFFISLLPQFFLLLFFLYPSFSPVYAGKLISSLFSHYSREKQKKTGKPSFPVSLFGHKPDLNRWPSDYESDALPTVLLWQLPQYSIGLLLFASRISKSFTPVQKRPYIIDNTCLSKKLI